MSDLNDPRVLFAAERTLLAWNRTIISLMAFGFLIERFGLFVHMAGREEVKLFQREISSYIGTAFIVLSVVLSILSILQYKRVLKTLRPVEIPENYHVWSSVWANALVGLMGSVLVFYIFLGINPLVIK